MAYPVGGITGSNNLGIVRNADGQIQVNVSNMRNRDIGIIGNVTGSASILLGANSSNGTEYMVYGEGTKIDMHDASQDTSFWGFGLDVDVSDTVNEANIQWNADASSLSTANTSRALTLEVTEGASDNIFTYGWGEAQILDAGDYNTHFLGAGGAYYASTETNRGALVFGGSGNADYDIAGSYGVFKQGTGMATYEINGELTDDHKFGFMNAILSDSTAVIHDKGAHSFIASTGKNSKVIVDGFRSLYSVSNPELVQYGTSKDASYAKECLVFAGGVTSFHDEDLDTTFKLSSLLCERGWANQSGKDGSYHDNWYLGATGSGAANHRTGALVSGLMSDWLTLGDAGWDNIVNNDRYDRYGNK